MDVRRQLAIAMFLTGVCLIMLIARPVWGVGLAWPANGMVAITFVIVVIFGWRVWEAVRRERHE